ncbi:MAG: carboxyl transferase domain-containing protein, partial [Acidimicrobiia bacterium]
MFEVLAPVAGRVVALPTALGAFVGASETVVVLEVMKMEHPVAAGTPGTVKDFLVTVGDTVDTGDSLIVLAPGEEGATRATPTEVGESTPLDDVIARHHFTLDEARPEAVATRHERGRRTARENLADLCSDFVEYGALAIAAQRRRRDIDDLIRRTPADGMIGGIGRIDTATVGDDRAIVVSYDYTVLAGTQGMQNHRKKDRLFALAAETGLPVVLFAEGGGGRPGDVDWPTASLLDVPAFRLFGEIPGPTIGINSGYCFAGNAALLGQCDVIVATHDSNLGMGGPAMIEGGGLGVFEPGAVGPATTQMANGVIDVPVADDAEAVGAVRTLVGLTRGTTTGAIVPEQMDLRDLVPTNRRQVYD